MIEKISDIPIDIIQLIKSWYSNQILHLINMETQKHWRIPVDTILE